MAEIAKAGIMSTPALDINGEVKIKSRVVTVEEIKEFIS
ncbi:MAG: thioredoxin family protein [Halanaerobiales bacterium]|nr:thioredoxin family protein [Halanaerobiales bacterium]